MEKTFIGVRGVDEETFRKFRAFVVHEKMKLGDALSLAMKNLLEERQEREKILNSRNLLKLEGIIKTKKGVRWSEEIDNFLYGLENDIT